MNIILVLLQDLQNDAIKLYKLIKYAKNILYYLKQY